MLRKTVYPKVENLLNQLAGELNRNGLSPNQLTLGGAAINFVTGWIYASGHLFWGGVFLLIAACGDLLDGPLARISGRTSKFGAFLDSTVDRYSDFFVLAGLALYAANGGHLDWFLLIMGIIAGSFVTSYAKARAENLIPNCGVGVFERAERVIILALGTLIFPIFPLTLWILCIGTNATAIHRILYTKKNLSEEK
ncbi:MAG: CDP-alcohol phosphatidyltransferase family protein [Candidatus Omnitrophica bacterium]|nr:CDP-alcohol phosphatidyltransferase family protein [Candidatus Omnitrophota bacterium]